MKYIYAWITFFYGTFSYCLEKQEFSEYNSPINCTKQSVQNFFENTFNKKNYARHYLPHNFQHINELLSYAGKMKNSADYISSVIEIFHNRLKESLWINPYGILGLLESCYRYCQPVITPERDPLSLQKSIKNLLLQEFLTRFNQFKENPNLFLDELSEEIMLLYREEINKNEPIKKMRTTITNFIESILNKLLWNVEEQRECWSLFCTISHQLYALRNGGILENDIDLNRCYWSLMYRFCHFLEISEESLTLETIQAIKADILKHELHILTAHEPEKMITSKKNYLESIIFELEVKKLLEEKRW